MGQRRVKEFRVELSDTEQHSGQHSSTASSFSAHSNLAAYGSSISCGQTGREHQAATVIYFTLGLAARCRCHSLSVCPSLSWPLQHTPSTWLIQWAVLIHALHLYSYQHSDIKMVTMNHRHTGHYIRAMSSHYFIFISNKTFFPSVRYDRLPQQLLLWRRSPSQLESVWQQTKNISAKHHAAFIQHWPRLWKRTHFNCWILLLVAHTTEI